MLVRRQSGVGQPVERNTTMNEPSLSIAPQRRSTRRVMLKGTALLAFGVADQPSNERVAVAAVDPLARQPVPAQAPAKEGIAALSGTRLFYWDTGGSGPAVVLLHPATGSALMWVYQQPVFANAGYRVIGYSRRGYYKSDAALKDNPGVAADDLHDLVGYLGIEKFHIVSSAAGGSVAADYALSHPEKLMSLVITSNSAGVSTGDIARLSASLQPNGFDQMPPEFRELGPSYRAADPEGVRQWLELEHRALDGELVRQRPGNAISAEKLNTIGVPTLLMTGDADLYTPPSLLRRVAAQIPGSEVVIVPETGHAIYWERPDIFNQVVLDFIGKHSK
jgi:pimeloyl-ACP methyl ester carboxylesterase